MAKSSMSVQDAGRLGGQQTSPAKRKATRLNLLKARATLAAKRTKAAGK